MTVLIVGATSAIAQAVARRFAADGAALVLAARDPEKLGAVADDLRARGASRVHTHRFDAADFAQHAALVEAVAAEASGGLDHALLAYGTLPDPSVVTTDAEAVAEAFTLNATSVVALMTRLATHLEQQGQGSLTVIASVAGDRGRPSNYVYGAAKGAVALFAAGLRARLAPRGVQVTTVKPGLVDTPMTAHLPKNALFADPADVGAQIHRAMVRRRDVAYVPRFWRPVMAAIRAVPERLFKRLDL